MNKETTSELTPEQIAEVEAKRKREAAELERMRLNKVLIKVKNDVEKQKRAFPDLTNEQVYSYHSNVLAYR